MRAFQEDQRWASQSFVAVADRAWTPATCAWPRATSPCATSSRTPCRCSSSPCAPRSTASTSPPPRAGCRACAPLPRSSRRSATPRCARSTPEPSPAGSASRSSRSRPRSPAPRGWPPARPRARARPPPGHRVDTETVPEPSLEEARATMPAPDLRDPVVFAERQLLQSLLQYPTCFEAAEVDAIAADSFSAPAHRAVFDGVLAAGGIQHSLSSQAWAHKVAEAAPLAVRGLVVRAVGGAPADALRQGHRPPRAPLHDRPARPRPGGRPHATDRRRDVGHAAHGRTTRTATPPRPAPSVGDLQNLQRELATLRGRAS